MEIYCGGLNREEYSESLKIQKEINMRLGFDSNYSFSMFDLRLNEDNTVDDEYKKAITFFHKAFELEDKGQTFLWNKIMFFTNEYGYKKYREEDFSKEELEFIKKAGNAKYVNENLNVNEDIFVDEDIVLTKLSDKDIDKIRKDVVFGENEYTKFTGHPYEDGNEDYLLDISLKFYFCIKYKNELVGYLGMLNVDDCNEDKYNLEIYTMKKHRDKGYMKRAVKKFIDYALSHKLVKQVKTKRLGISKIVNEKVNIISITTREDNFKTIHILESLNAHFDGEQKYLYKENGIYYSQLAFSIVGPYFNKDLDYKNILEKKEENA